MTPPPATTGHAALPGEPALYQVTGYDYSDVARGDFDPTSFKQAINKGSPGYVTAASVHKVSTSAESSVYLIEAQVAKAHRGDASTVTAIEKAMATVMAGEGADVSTRTLSTQKVVRATATANGEKTTVYGWYHAGVITWVIGVAAKSSVLGDVESFMFVDRYLKGIHAG